MKTRTSAKKTREIAVSEPAVETSIQAAHPVLPAKAPVAAMTAAAGAPGTNGCLNSHSEDSSSISALAGAVGAGVTVNGAGTVDAEAVARLAYSFWQARGFRHGSAEEDWYRAEEALRAGTAS